MKLLEDFKIQCTDWEWFKTQSSDAFYDWRKANGIISLTWGYPFERTGTIVFKSKSDAMLFFLKWA